MNAPTLPLRPAAADSLLAGLPLALLAHALLLIALAVGVNWRSSDDSVAEAELWAVVPQVAAPPLQEPEPEPPKPTPAPEPQVDRAAEQRAAEEQREAEIALERERERRLQRQREEEAERKAKAEKLKKEKLEQQRRENEAKKKAEEQQRKKTEDANAAKAAKAEEARREKQRQENLRRMQGLAGGTGHADSTGSAAKSAGPSAGYGGRIKARIKPNITLTETPSGNPLAEVEVKTAPDGLILARRLLRPSGDAAWDAAVLRAIDKTERLPRDEDGRVPPVLIISFRPND